MNVEEILAWCLFPLALAGVASFASAMQDDIVRWRRRKQRNTRSTTIGLPSIPEPKPPRSAARQRIVRGYDSPELFRQDYWLLRIDHSRQRIAGGKGSLQLLELSIGIRDEYGKQVCAVLAQHQGAGRDN
jgi:hypothetical protein